VVNVKGQSRMDAIKNIPDVTGVILKWSEGDKHAQEQLYLFSYQNFKELARKVKNKVVEKHGEEQFSLMNVAANTTSLVHDAYIKISQSKEIDHPSRQAFYSHFSQSIYSILIDHSRKLLAGKRQNNYPATDSSLQINEKEVIQLERLIELDSELKFLAQSHSRQVRTFLLKYVCAMPHAEITAIQQVSESTVEKDLLFVKSQLTNKLSK
jgi:RNA polymerase sigma factor (TIGR02999 family)